MEMTSAYMYINLVNICTILILFSWSNLMYRTIDLIRLHFVSHKVDFSSFLVLIIKGQITLSAIVGRVFILHVVHI